MENEGVVVELVLNLLGIPPLNKIRNLSEKSKRKTKVTLIRKDKKPVNITEVLRKLENIVDIEETKEVVNEVKELYPITIVQGLYEGRIIIYGDMPGLLTHVFSEIIALANGLLDCEVPKRIVEELNKKLSDIRLNVQIFVVPGMPCVKACHMFAHIALALKNLRVEIIDANSHSEYFEERSNGALPLIIVNDDAKKTGSPWSYKEIKELLEKSVRS